MTAATVLFWSVLVLLVLLVGLMVDRYNKEVKKANRDEEIMAYTLHMSRVYKNSNTQMDIHATQVAPSKKDQWCFFTIAEERKVAL